MKSGTSSLFALLSQHPQIFKAIKKEVHFFDDVLDCYDREKGYSDVDNFVNGQAWYRAHFPLKRKMNIDYKSFEASPKYIFHPLCPKRIFNLVPKVKIIAILRNPTERAISHYFHVKNRDLEPLSIFEALQEEENRLEPVIKRKDYYSKEFAYYSYKSRGLYKKQIERYLNYFPWQQILILSSDAFFRNPFSTLRQVYEFVGVDIEYKVKDLRPRNVSRNRYDVDSTIYEYLNEYFLPHNKALYELVQKNYGW
jgi:hypothetical protein